MEAVLSMLGMATLLLISVAVILALIILVLHEARHIVRLGMRLRVHAKQDHEKRGE
jgi:hypothetical protein